MASKNAKEHATFIDRLGGTYAVHAYIVGKTGKKLTTQAVSMMKKQGITFYYRPLLAEWAKERRVKVPKNFLVPRA